MSWLTPEALLGDWRAAGLPFRTPPRLIGALAGGISNRSYLIEADERRWVLRLDAPGAAALGVDRAREHAVQRAAAAEGLAPELAAADAAQGFLVSAFVAGRQALPGHASAGQQAAMLALLARVARLEVDVPAIDYGAHIARYAGAAPLPDDLPPRLARLAAAAPSGLCHHDPTPANVVFTATGPVLLDWEYAAPGAPVMDLAVLVCEWRAPPDRIAARAQVEPGLLEDACSIYRTLCALWHRRDAD
ncbi:MAG: choline/ethanolamine kinase family protein, partial [Gammaproteobacteria bacterium]